MNVGIRDDTLMAGGFATISEGMTAVGAATLEMNVSRDGRIRSLTGAGETLNLDTEAGRASLKQQCGATGLTVSALMLGNNFNAEDTPAEIDWVVRAATAAQALGIRRIRVDSIMRGERDLPVAARVERFSEAMRAVLEQTAGTGVLFGVENHGWGGNDPEFLHGVLAAIGSPQFGVTLDTGNFYWHGNPVSRLYSIYERLAPHVKHTHVKSIHYPADIRDTRREIGYKYGEFCSPLDEGDIDVSRVIAILRGAGYDGDLVIENESIGRFPEAERVSVIKRDVDHLKKLLG